MVTAKREKYRQTACFRDIVVMTGMGKIEIGNSLSLLVDMMINMPSISVIIPSHNCRTYIGQTLDSILSQTLPVSEVLVVDDSGDNSAEVIEAYVKKSGGVVRLIAVPPCTNSRARNAGLELARGEFAAFLDADDIWLPEKTARQVELLSRHPEAVGVYCQLFTFQNDLDDLGRPVWERAIDNPSVENLLRGQMVAASTAMLRRSKLGDVRFDETTNHAEDTVFTAELRLAGPWRLLPQALLARRIRGGQLTASPQHTLRNFETRLRWLDRCAARLGVDEAAHLREQLESDFVDWLETLYWERQVADLPKLRREAALLCPKAMSRSFLSRRYIWPQWVYRVVDRLRPSQ